MSEVDNTHVEFLVHGKITEAVIVPGAHSALEMWIKPTQEVEIFSVMVQRQCGATIRGNHLWLFRPVDLPVSEGEQVVMSRQHLAVDAGYVREEEIAQIRQKGLKVRRDPTHPDPLSGVVIITPGDVIDFPVPIRLSQVMISTEQAPPPIEGKVPIQPTVVAPELQRAASSEPQTSKP